MVYSPRESGARGGGGKAMTQYAVNLIAMLNASKQIELLPVYLILRTIITDTVIHTDKDVPEKDALLVRDDIEPERWNAIAKIIRLRIDKHTFPLYVKEKRWRSC